MQPSSRRPVRPSALVVFGLLASVAACNRTPAGSGAAVTADTWAVVNGKAITRQDVDKAYRRSRDAGGPTPSEEETMMAKMGLLDDLITQEILLEKATALKVEVPQSELDSAEANAKKNMPDDVFQQQLTQRGLTAADMREGLRRQLLIEKLVTKEVTEKIVISDQEINDFFNANKAQFNLPEEAYHLAQIVITPVAEPQPSNSTGDDAQTPQAAAQKAQMLMQRLKEPGASFSQLAAAYSEDAESAARGGDMGLVPISQLAQAPPQLKAAVLGKPPGAVNVAASNGAYTLVLVVSHELAGQRDLNTPGMKDNLQKSLKDRKEQVLRAAFITAARNDAKVEHHLARRLVEAKGVVAGGQPVTPAAGAANAAK